MKQRSIVALAGMVCLMCAAQLTTAEFRQATYAVREAVSMVGPGGWPLATPAKVVEFVVSSADKFPARALDPVLHVGKIEVREYRYADISNRTLIFTLFEPEKLSDDVPVYLQYEYDQSTHTELPQFRLNMIQPLKK